MKRDFYAILSVPRNAKPAAIKRRFLELARERHPDRFQGAEKEAAEREFQDITEAFNVLTDPLRRRQHDLELTMPSTGGSRDPKQETRVYMNRGIRAYRRGSLAEAADNFERATHADPTSAQAWHHLALACSKEERWLAKAQQAIERACELRPRHAPYLKLAGKIFAGSRMTGRAKEYYNRALEVTAGFDPSIHKALRDLGGPPRGGDPRSGDPRSGAPRSGDPRSGAPAAHRLRKAW